MPALYRIYRRATPTATPSPVTTVAAGTTQCLLTALGDSSVGYYSVKAVTTQGVEDHDAPQPRLALVALDGSGNLIQPAPAPPIKLLATPGSGGSVSVVWQQIDQAYPGVAAASFNVYTGVNGAVNYTTAAATVTANSYGQYSATLGPYSTGDVVTMVVRSQSAITSGGVEETNIASVQVTADATAPAPITALTVQVVAQ